MNGLIGVTETKIVEPVKVDDPKTIVKAKKPFDRLRVYNIVLAVIHLIICVFLIVYFAKIREKNKDKPVDYINLDLFRHAFKFNSPKNFAQVVSEKAMSVGETGVTTLIVTFFAITAGFHLLYAVNPGDIYINGVLRGNNYLRWIEYGISATMMIVIIALLSGVKDINNYVLLIVSAIAIMSTGQWFETAKGNGKWIPIIVGFVVMLGVFSVIFSSFSRRIKEGKEAGFKPPTWLYAIVIVMFIFYSSFGFVPIAQMIFKGNNRKYEYSYLTLSLVSKVSLGMLVAVGFGSRQSAENPS